MAEKYYSIITNRGKDLEAASSAGGPAVVLKNFVVGDGNGQAVTPDPARTSLVHAVIDPIAISSLEVSPDQSNQWIAHLVLPSSVGGFTVREMGLLTDAGELYAVCNCAAIEKPESGISINAQFRLAVSETAEIELIVATGDGLFLRQDANLNDVKDKAESRSNLGLKSAAVADVTSSVADNAPGRVLKVGDYGLTKAISVPANTDLAAFFATALGAFYHCDNATSYTNHPGFGSNWFDVHITVHEVTNYRTLIAVSGAGNLAVASISGITGGYSFSGWKKVYSELEKPVPKEIFPLSENIGNAADLNNYTTPGLYFQSANAQAATGKNYPESNAGSLEVYKHAGISQVYRIYNSSRTYIRSLYGGSWSAWVKQYDTANKPSYTDVGALASNGTAVAASKLATARTINGVAFDGTKNISISASQIGSYTKSESDTRFGKGRTQTGSNSTYYSHPNGTVFMQSVRSIYVGNSTTVTVTLPTSFPNGIIGIGGTFYGSGGKDSDSFYQFTPVGKNQVQIRTQNCSGTFSVVVTGY